MAVMVAEANSSVARRERASKSIQAGAITL
jgi:hypothetical protein